MNGILAGQQNKLTTATNTSLTGIIIGNGSKLDTATVDNAPTIGSDNLVKSGGVATAFADVAQATEDATTTAFTATLLANNWTISGDIATQSILLSAIRCGVGGNVPPIVTWTGDSNSFEGYNKITEAVATAGVGVTFTVASDDIPEYDVDIIISDVG